MNRWVGHRLGALGLVRVPEGMVEGPAGDDRSQIGHKDLLVDDDVSGIPG